MADGVADLGIGGGAGQAGRQVHHGHVRRWHTEGHAGHLTLQGGNDPAHGLGGAGGGGDDVVEDGAAGAPVAAATGVHGLLLGGGGVDGGHEALLDAELLMHHLGQRGQTVGGAAGIGDYLHIRAVQAVVDAEHEGGCHLVLGGGRQQHLFGAALEVAGGLLGGVVGTGGLDDVLGAALMPGDHGGVRLAEHLDLMAVDHQIAALVLHRAVEVAEYGVVFQQVHHVVHVRLAEVDAADLVLLRILRQNPQHHTADTAEAVDTNFDGHNPFPFTLLRFRRPGRLFLFRVYYTKPAAGLSAAFGQNGTRIFCAFSIKIEHMSQKY